MNARERKDCADLARIMALMCVRNSGIEDIHAGKSPVSRTGDFSDVFVVDAEERRIPWPEVSHFDDKVMRDLMRQIVDRMYTLHVKAEDPDFQAILKRWMSVALGWDAPKLDAGFMRAIEARRVAGDEPGSANQAGPRSRGSGYRNGVTRRKSTRLRETR